MIKDGEFNRCKGTALRRQALTQIPGHRARPGFELGSTRAPAKIRRREVIACGFGLVDTVAASVTHFIHAKSAHKKMEEETQWQNLMGAQAPHLGSTPMTT